MREVHETGREKGVCKNTAAERAGERRGGVNISGRERPRERKAVHETAERQGGM